MLSSYRRRLSCCISLHYDDLVETNGLVNWNPVDRWLRDKKPGTQKVYEKHMARFVDGARFKTPLEFLAWARAQEVVAVEETIQRFLRTLPQASRGTGASALKTYLELNGCRGLSKDLVSHEVREATENRQFYRGFTREEIQLILRYLDDDLQQLFVYVERGKEVET